VFVLSRADEEAVNVDTSLSSTDAMCKSVTDMSLNYNIVYAPE
jgi:hypothetical protein